MTPKKHLSGAERCAQNVALLEILSLLPEAIPPIRIPHEGESALAGNRRLSFDQEKELATTFAFLSSSNEDINYITAVCVEEIPHQDKCKLLVAVNKASVNDGRAVLDRLQKRFTQIFGRLNRISKEHSQSDLRIIRNQVLNDIVAMCHDRILGRLGSRKAKGTTNQKKQKKRFLGIALQEFVNTNWQWRARGSRSEKMSQDDLKDYQRRIEKLLGALTDFESTMAEQHDCLVHLVTHIHRFMSKVPFQKLLDCLTELDMQSTARQRLYSNMSKIARYRESATFLCVEARKHPALQDITFQRVNLAAGAFARPSKSTTCSTSGIDPTLARLSMLTRHTKKGLTVTKTTLPPWTQDANRRFAESVSTILRKAKIHAEIQILAHYEGRLGADTATQTLRPRVIASSKDACYLCNTLIALHGAYFVPKTHGKLYPGWRLPATPNFGPLQERLNIHLEQVIAVTNRRLCQLQQKPKTNFGNESTIFPLVIAASSWSTFSNASVLDLSVTSVAEGSTISAAVLPSIVEEETSPETLENEQTSGPSQSPIDSVARLSCGEVGSFHATDAQDEPLVDVSPSTEPEEHAVAEFERDSTENVNEEERECSSDQEEPKQLQTYRFRHGNLEIFLESSAHIVPRQLSTAESHQIRCSDSEMIVDVLKTEVGGPDVSLRKTPDGKAYFSHMEQVFVIDTGVCWSETKD